MEELRQVRLYRQETARITRQMAVMLQSGLTLRSALEVLSGSATDEVTGLVTTRLLSLVESGWKLSSALRTMPGVFDTVYISMVEVGEETGQLVGTLLSLADWIEAEGSLVRKVRGALTYPMIVLLVAALLTVGFFTQIFPSFAESLKSVENLPALTSLLILISDLLRSPLFWMVCVAAAIFGFKGLSQVLKAPAHQVTLWRLFSQVPVLGPLLRDFAASRFAAAMAILLQTGVDILKSFRLAATASGSPLLKARMGEGLAFLSHGGELSEFMKLYPDIYPSIMTGLVLVGQESATLPWVLGVLQRSLTEETEHRLDVLTALLEPVLMAFVASLVGVLIIGVAMPMYGLASSL